MKTKIRRIRDWSTGALLIWLAFAPLAQAFYNPSTGKWLTRDPLKEEGAVNLYGFVENDPQDYVDSIGLKKLSKDEGAKVIDDGLKTLNSACDKACVPKACCTPARCKQEAKNLIDLLVNAWNRNHGKGPSTSRDAVGGFLCWDWALIFQDAAKAVTFQCFHHEIGMAVKTGFVDELGRVPVHYYLEVYACKRKLAEFQVSFDDGFLDGINAVHAGRFPEEDDDYDDTNPPRPIKDPPPSRFTPTPPVNGIIRPDSPHPPVRL